jgi:hypothetical protein
VVRHRPRTGCEGALATFAHCDAVAVRWRSFEPDPSAPAKVRGAYVDRLARKYGTSRERAQAMIDRVTAQGAAEGVAFRFDGAQPGNTFDAHRLLHLAADRGVQDAVRGRLMTGYLSEGAAIAIPGPWCAWRPRRVWTHRRSRRALAATCTPTRSAPTNAKRGRWGSAASRSSSSTGGTASRVRSPAPVLQQVLTQAWNNATA